MNHGFIKWNCILTPTTLNCLLSLNLIVYIFSPLSVTQANFSPSEGCLPPLRSGLNHWRYSQVILLFLREYLKSNFTKWQIIAQPNISLISLSPCFYIINLKKKKKKKESQRYFQHAAGHVPDQIKTGPFLLPFYSAKMFSTAWPPSYPNIDGYLSCTFQTMPPKTVSWYAQKN